MQANSAPPKALRHKANRRISTPLSAPAGSILQANRVTPAASATRRAHEKGDTRRCRPVLMRFLFQTNLPGTRLGNKMPTAPQARASAQVRLNGHRHCLAWHRLHGAMPFLPRL